MIVSKNIYLADDDTDDHDFFSYALEEICSDCNLTLSASGDELLDNLRKPSLQKPDVIFLDINMPRKSGIETLKAIKADPSIRDLPVIIYSTSSNPEYIKQAKDEGACYYFVKPSDFSKLKQLLEKTLSINWSAYTVPADLFKFVIA
jgi:CheY-like chemotaxis protein